MSGRSIAGVPEVSVIIPTRDRCERLRLTMRSALAQNDVVLEVIVVDDGSSDGTARMLETFDDARVRLARNEVPVGESGARNRGIEMARGTWIAFLDDDDLWSPDKLALQLDALRATGRGWAYGGHVVIDGNLDVLYGSPPPTPEDVATSLVRHNAVPASASNVVVASELLTHIGLFDPELRRTPDWDMWLRLVRVGLPASVNKPIVAICVHPGNMSRDMDLLFRELDVLAARYRIPVDRAQHHRWAAWSSMADGRRGDAIRHYFRAASAGDLASIARAVGAVVPPRFLPRRPSHWRLGSGNRAWTEEARRWLEPLASAQGGPPCFPT
jgi:glycosyltransferase involved in cell wall biosynthesis